jgi:hypothetical protein
MSKMGVAANGQFSLMRSPVEIALKIIAKLVVIAQCIV